MFHGSGSRSPGEAILHAATAVANGSQSRLVPDQPTGLEQRTGVSMGL